MAAKKDSKLALKLITNVSDFGLLTTLAKTRLRLFLSTLVSNVGFVAATWHVSHYVNEQSDSVSLNLVYITATMLLLLVASYIEAMLLGDLFFPGPWRERILLGKKIDIDINSPEALQVSNHRNYNLHFMIVLAFTIVANYYGTRILTGDYLDEYHQVGFHLTNLRADQPEEKLTALKALSKTIYRKRWHEKKVKLAILDQLKSDDEETRRWAIFIIGQARYEEGFAILTEAIKQGDPQTRAEAAQSLGSLLDSRSAQSLHDLLKQAAADKDKNLMIGALRGIGLMGDKANSTGPTILELFTKETDEELRAYLGWALGQARYKEAYPVLWKTFEESDETSLKCASLEGLKYLSQNSKSEGDVAHAKEFFTLIDRHECPYLIWEDRHEEKIYIMYKEFYRTKLLKIVANRTGGAELPWFEFIAADQENPYAVRYQATEIVRMTRGR